MHGTARNLHMPIGLPLNRPQLRFDSCSSSLSCLIYLSSFNLEEVLPFAPVGLPTARQGHVASRFEMAETVDRM